MALAAILAELGFGEFLGIGSARPVFGDRAPANSLSSLPDGCFEEGWLQTAPLLFDSRQDFPPEQSRRVVVHGVREWRFPWRPATDPECCFRYDITGHPLGVAGYSIGHVPNMLPSKLAIARLEDSRQAYGFTGPHGNLSPLLIPNIDGHRSNPPPPRSGPRGRGGRGTTMRVIVRPRSRSRACSRSLSLMVFRTDHARRSASTSLFR